MQSLIPYKTASLWAFSLGDQKTPGPVLETPEGIFTAKLLPNSNILRGSRLLDIGRVRDEPAQEMCDTSRWIMESVTPACWTFQVCFLMSLKRAFQMVVLTLEISEKVLAEEKQVIF